MIDRAERWDPGGLPGRRETGGQSDIPVPTVGELWMGRGGRRGWMRSEIEVNFWVPGKVTLLSLGVNGLATAGRV